MHVLTGSADVLKSAQVLSIYAVIVPNAASGVSRQCDRGRRGCPWS